MRSLLLLVIIFLGFQCQVVGEEDFLNNVNNLDSIARRINLELRVNYKPEYNMDLAMHENLGVYFDRAYTSRMSLSQRGKMGWIKAAIIYRTLSRWPKSVLWQYLGESYYNVKLNMSEGALADVKKLVNS
ncbi:MAG: hypothetical protein ACRC37_07675, partial [Lentisphaeria bacterium]